MSGETAAIYRLTSMSQDLQVQLPATLAKICLSYSKMKLLAESIRTSLEVHLQDYCRLSQSTQDCLSLQFWASPTFLPLSSALGLLMPLKYYTGILALAWGSSCIQ